MNSSDSGSTGRSAMLRRLDDVIMTPHDRAQAKASMLRAEAMIDFFCYVGSSLRRLASAFSTAASDLRRKLRPLEHRP